MNSSNLADAQDMFKHACAFWDCAHLCEVESSKIEYRFFSHTVVGVVNYAFACEIFIKALLRMKGKTFNEIKGIKHSLNDLWMELKDLDGDITEKVEKKINEGTIPIDEEKFNRHLQDASKAFEHWRYIYEKEEGKVNLPFLRNWGILLRDVCCRHIFEKSWGEFKRNL